MYTHTRKDGNTLNLKQLIALKLAELGVRNSIREDFHAGIAPRSATVDYSDVKVVTPFGERGTSFRAFPIRK